MSREIHLRKERDIAIEWKDTFIVSNIPSGTISDILTHHHSILILWLIGHLSIHKIVGRCIPETVIEVMVISTAKLFTESYCSPLSRVKRKCYACKEDMVLSNSLIYHGSFLISCWIYFGEITVQLSIYLK
jgi:hypothetical protein